MNFDWSNILLGDEEWTFLFTIAFRTFIMFLIIMTSLRMLGKRGVKQLSVFELGVIIGLGSAAGDPMFYDDVGVLASGVVILTVVFLYRALTIVMDKNEKIERVMEGKPVTIVQNGRMLLESVQKETLSKPELFMQLRLNRISHLGQVKLAILESTGELSVFYFRDEEVVFGLPILPEVYDFPSPAIKYNGYYSCSVCSHTHLADQPLKEESLPCPDCGSSSWIEAMNEKRIS